MDKPYNDVALLLEKMTIDENIFLLKPIESVVGNYEEETDSFVMENDIVLPSVNDVVIHHQNEERLFFSNSISKDYLLGHYSAITLEEAKEELLKESKEYIWLGKITEKETLEITPFPVDKINILSEVAYEDTLEVIDEYSPENNQSKEIETLMDLVNFEALKDQIFNLKVFVDEKYTLSLTNDIDSFQPIINIHTSFDFDEKTREELEEKNKSVASENEEQYDEAKEVYTEDVSKNINMYEIIDVKDMYKYITDRVIGQDEPVRQIITAFLMNKVDITKAEEDDLTRILITGGTGSGKTLIIETLMDYLKKVHELDFPMAKVPTSQLTAAGYVGMDLEDILIQLVDATTGDFSSTLEKVEYAEENGIVFFDEIDKKGSDNNRDVSGRGVLNALLEFLTGADYVISVGREQYIFNTAKLTIFAAGAFTNVFDEKKKQGIGFNVEEKVISEQLTPKDFIELGQMPNELIGRFHKIVFLNPITKETLKKILTDSKKSSLSSTKEKLENLGIKLNYDETYLEKIAEEAQKRNLGARSLKTLIEESLFEIMWEGLTAVEGAEITVDENTINNPKEYTLYKKKKDKNEK